MTNVYIRCIQNNFFDVAKPLITSYGDGKDKTSNIESFFSMGFEEFYYHMHGAHHFVLVHVQVNKTTSTSTLHILDSIKGYTQSHMQEAVSEMKKHIQEAWNHCQTRMNPDIVEGRTLNFVKVYPDVPQQSEQSNDCLVASCYILFHIYSSKSVQFPLVI
jgi:hypothetical protein